MNLFSLASFVGFLAVGFLMTSLKLGKARLQEVYVDRHGDTWLIPTAGWVTDITNYVIEATPRLSKSFKIVSPDFDLENQAYVDTSVMYIVLAGAVGLVFLVCIALFFIIRYACGCCGGRKLPRRGYSQSAITGVRMSLVVFSFLFEGIVLYGFFANTDLHTSLGRLVDVFGNVSVTLGDEMDLLIDSMPNATGNGIYDMYKLEFKEDLKFSTRYATSSKDMMKSLMAKFEGLRMAVILVSLIVATLGCAIGIAAGSVSKGVPVIIMIVLNTVSGTIIFFSAGTHFAGSKMVYEYCDEIEYYLKDGNMDVIPMRLQFFVPCIASPVFPFMQDYYVINGVRLVDNFTELMKATNVWADESSKLKVSPAQWFNVTDTYYQEQIDKISDEAQKTQIQAYYGEVRSFVGLLHILDRNQHCTYSKNEMRGEDFLMCTYMKDNLDMLTMTQVVAAVLIVIITCIGIPAIRKFEWAGNANLGGVLNGKKKFNGKGARPKRKIGKSDK